MRRRSLVIAALLGAAYPLTASLLAVTQADQKVLALAGCCKVRNTPNDPWHRTNLTFDQCRARNDSVDRSHNIFDQSGLVWWDVTC